MQPIADLTPPGVVTKTSWWVNRINVPEQHRGKGYGSQLLKMITDDADAEGVVLELEIYSSGPLDDDALKAWYERHGFVENYWTLKRQPNTN